MCCVSVHARLYAGLNEAYKLIIVAQYALLFSRVHSQSVIVDENVIP